MTSLAFLLLAMSVVTFRGYVPPHAASDGLVFRVAAASETDVPATLKACGIDDFGVLVAEGSHASYQFAVTRATEANARCVGARLPAGSRLTQADRWAGGEPAH